MMISPCENIILVPAQVGICNPDFPGQYPGNRQDNRQGQPNHLVDAPRSKLRKTPELLVSEGNRECPRLTVQVIYSDLVQRNQKSRYLFTLADYTPRGLESKKCLTLPIHINFMFNPYLLNICPTIFDLHFNCGALRIFDGRRGTSQAGVQQRKRNNSASAQPYRCLSPQTHLFREMDWSGKDTSKKK
eukprot:TRINITY_DN9273_c0_g2_i2.p2 TRINITY_DN9273_c0_g2~~TRINITY_DN9273_c0_g2_i2.p2  ORF type:complete len:188 (-),score=3.16 TRINITY_DN9273_c0_g2_i2:619-1182(-)